MPQNWPVNVASSALARPSRSLTAPTLLLLTALLGITPMMGCGGGGERPQPDVEARLQKLAVSFGRFVQQNRGQSPPNEAAFRGFLDRMDQGQRATLDITNVDELFVSPRDQQPFVVRYGVNVNSMGPQGPPVIAYEQTGEGGDRYVAFALGGVEEVDEARFRQLVPEP